MATTRDLEKRIKKLEERVSVQEEITKEILDFLYEIGYAIPRISEKTRKGGKATLIENI